MGKPKHGDDPRGERAASDPNRHGKAAADGERALHERKIEHPDFERDGAHRLFENRTQHDEAERASEKNRRGLDVDRHHHDRDAFQLRDGAENHPQGTADDHARVKSTGQGGGNRSDADRGQS